MIVVKLNIMKEMKKVSMYVISLVILLGITNLMAFSSGDVHKEFKGKSIVKIKTVSYVLLIYSLYC